MLSEQVDVAPRLNTNTTRGVAALLILPLRESFPIPSILLSTYGDIDSRIVREYGHNLMPPRAQYG